MSDQDKNTLSLPNEHEDSADFEAKEPLENLDDPVKLYLREITALPLLSNEAEFRLALAVQADELAKTYSNPIMGMDLHAIITDMQSS